MALTPGVITIGAVTSGAVQLSATKPSTGTAPFTYQFYRSTTTGFSPGPSNAVGSPIESSAASVGMTDTTVVPGTLYYYKLIATEDGPTPDTATYTQQSTTSGSPTQNINQFAQSPYLGMIDMRFPINTVSVLIDMAQATGLYAGQPVKIVDSAGGVPKVIGITADTDNVFGYINFDIKTQLFTAGMPCEVSIGGNVMYLYAVAAIARGVQVCCSLITKGGVVAATGSSAKRIVGWTYDKATAQGQLIRVYLDTPSFKLDS